MRSSPWKPYTASYCKPLGARRLQCHTTALRRCKCELIPPSAAIILWLVLLLILLRWDPARDRGSPARLIPLIWLSIAATRLPSQWLFGIEQISSAAYEEGNSLDRTVYLGLMVIAV